MTDKKHIEGYVYTLTFPGGYTYVGSTIRSVRERITNHIAEIKAGRGCPRLAEIAQYYGFEHVYCEDTGWNRWQFKHCVVMSKKYRVANRKELRKIENRTIRSIKRSLRLNHRTAYIKPEDNDFSNSVSAQSWNDLLVETNQDSG